MMLVFTKGDNAQMDLTLTEKQTIPGAKFLFVFENDEFQQARFFKLASADQSAFTDRYNRFTIAVNDYFADKIEGQWMYKVYEQETDDVSTTTSGKTCLETGIMLLKSSTTSASQYTPTQTETIVYNAE
jgi:hypothetical protein